MQVKNEVKQSSSQVYTDNHRQQSNEDLYYSTNFQVRQPSATQYVYQKQYNSLNKREVNDKVDAIHSYQQTPAPSMNRQIKEWRQHMNLPRVQSSTIYSKARVQQELISLFQRCRESVSPVHVQGRPIYSANIFQNKITRHNSADMRVVELEQQKNKEVETNTQIRQLRTVQRLEVADPAEISHSELLKQIRSELGPQKQRLYLKNGIFHYK